MPEKTCQRPGCGRQIPSRKRKDARWCSRSCESKARRAAARKVRFEAANPGSAELLGAEGQSLTDLYDGAGRPDHWDDPETKFSDEFDLLHDDQDDEHQDDETGIVGGDGDPGYNPDTAWAARQEFASAVERIQARYESQLRPYRDALRRNLGVKPVAMARIEAQRDAEIQELTRAHQLAEAYELAARDQPYRRASAHERAVEKAAARSFANDLGRGRHLRNDPADVGRATSDAFMFGEARPVFSSDNLRNSGVARSLYGHWGDERSQRW
jgi:hypothetical protein